MDWMYRKAFWLEGRTLWVPKGFQNVTHARIVNHLIDLSYVSQFFQLSCFQVMHVEMRRYYNIITILYLKPSSTRCRIISVDAGVTSICTVYILVWVQIFCVNHNVVHFKKYIVSHHANMDHRLQDRGES